MIIMQVLSEKKILNICSQNIKQLILLLSKLELASIIITKFSVMGNFADISI